MLQRNNENAIDIKNKPQGQWKYARNLAFQVFLALLRRSITRKEQIVSIA